MPDTVENHPFHLEQILNNSPDGVFTISPQNEILYVNPAFCRILGFTADELLGTEIHQYLGDLDIFEACSLEVAKKGFCHDQETIFKRKDGSMVHISKNVQAICDDAGKLTEVLVTIRDLSELHQLNKDLTSSQRELEIKNQVLNTMLDDLRDTQQQLVEAEKMASLGGLVAGIAHEINTPLGISVTSASTMQREVKQLEGNFRDGKLKKSEMEFFFQQAHEACNILNTNLQRASDLVRSFKQVAVDQTHDEIRKINLKDYLNEVLVSIGPSYKRTAITLQTECDSSINLMTNPGAISQIVSNLVINSVTHAFEQGEKGKIRLKFLIQDNQLVFLFEDNGKGINPEHLKQIFIPFFTTKRGTGGTGLGLSIVYNLVTATLNGKIEVESNESQGTKFNISFPLEQD